MTMSDDTTITQARFSAMTDGTAEDWQVIARTAGADRAHHVDRVLAHLRMLDNDQGGYAVDRLEHSLQTATRAHKDGRDEEYVVCALLHDIGDILLPSSHADLAATLLKPYVSEANHWMVEKHGIFQGYYFWHHIGLDRDAREQFRGHPAFEYTAQFCHLYDQPAFDGAYESMPLDAFIPMMHRVMDRPKQSMYLKKSGESVMNGE